MTNKANIKQKMVEILDRGTVSHCSERMTQKLREKCNISISDDNAFTYMFELVTEGRAQIHHTETGVEFSKPKAITVAGRV